MRKLTIFYNNGKINEVLLLPFKGTNTYSYVNLTKGHICTCKFNSIEDALNDLTKYTDTIRCINMEENYEFRF